jgi:DNA-binding CsgD family transcriptional regulator
LTDIELFEPDVNKFRDLAVAGRPAASMSEATGGKLDRSARYRELMRPRGFGDELRVACMDGSRTCGVIVMHRDLGRSDFGAHEVRLLASLSTRLAEAFQRASLQHGVTSDATPRRDGEPGLLLLDDEDRLETANEAAGGWLEELREDGRELPLVIVAVAHCARAVHAGRSDVIATARVRAASGRWALVRGSLLLDGARKRTAVTIEAARVPELAALIVDAYGLTQKERLVTELVAQGLSTTAIADQLHLSTFTVQDHLKAIFDKLDVTSRGELVATLFVDHYLVNGSLSNPHA